MASRRGKEHRSAIDEIRSMLVFHVFQAYSSSRSISSASAAWTWAAVRRKPPRTGSPGSSAWDSRNGRHRCDAALAYRRRALLFVAGLWLLAKELGELWVFFAVAVVGSPALFR